jgi:hypothetical protein
MDSIMLCGAIVAAQHIVADTALILEIYQLNMKLALRRRGNGKPLNTNAALPCVLSHQKLCKNLYAFWIVFLLMAIVNTLRKFCTAGSSSFLLIT